MIESSAEFDDLINLCGHSHRRIVLALLVDQEQAFTVNDLTKAIIKHNHHMPLREVSGETQKQIKTSLHHCHIPQLTNTGLVEYDSDRHLITPTDKLEEIAPHILSILDADPGLARPAEM